ncbi:MAG: GAF domain-containing sensor histidine kinase [Elainellaceae cyanobacterium]
MLKPASSKFVNLCQTQINLLKRGLGASLGIIYLTEESSDGEDARLTPVVAYPEAAMNWDAGKMLSPAVKEIRQSSQIAQLLPSNWQESTAQNGLPALPASQTNQQKPPHETGSQTSIEARWISQSNRQIAVPLIHEDLMVGLLVTARSDRDWSEGEQFQIEHIAQTIAIACVLDQQSQWLEHELHQQQMLQAQQHDLFHDLLHQFRNPLTALRTFGKLLMKRLSPEDKSLDVAEGIVRESDRLQDLLKQFDVAVSWGDHHLLPSDTSDDEPITWSASIDASSDSPASAASAPPSPLLLPGNGGLAGSSLQIKPCFILEVLEPLALSAAAIAQEREIDLQTFAPSDLPPVQADIQALREVLNNLIDNALKYTPAGGTIEIWAGIRQAQKQAIVIADTGPGIPRSDLDHIFERHYRGVQGTGDIQGSGLGLAIAQNLVTQMNGEIQVFSPARTSELVAGLAHEWGTKDYPGTAFVLWLPEA